MAFARSDIPYRSQHASSSPAGETVARRMAVADDPRWRETGEAEREERVRWARSGCGMACLQMILAARGDQAVPALAELGRRAITYGAYEARPARGFGPLIYAGFVDFVAAEFELRASVAAPLELDELASRVAADEVVLASVSNEIRALPRQPARRGGHLVLVFDASSDGKRLRFHDPAGDGPHNTSGVWLELAAFERFYAGRGIAVELPRA
jgi:hypothetical protein